MTGLRISFQASVYNDPFKRDPAARNRGSSPPSPFRMSISKIAMKSRAALLLASAVLTLLGCAYYFTSEPAPLVIIKWREGTTSDRKAAVERWFGLVRARDPEGRAVTYDLVDTRRANINELLEQHEVEGVGYIDAATNTVSGNAAYGRGRMWLGDRLPVVRAYRVVPVIIAACSLVIAYAFAKEIVARRRRAQRLLAFLLGSRRPRFARAEPRLTDRPPDRDERPL